MTMDEANWQVKIYRFIATKTGLVKQLFFLGYVFIVLFLLLSSYLISTQSVLEPIIYGIGKKFGQLSLLILALIVTPGILGRFRLEIPVSRIITAYRRQLGITTFLLAFSHASIVRILPKLLGIIPIFPLLVFETLGQFALLILFFMFLTSNNFSVKKLGKNWKRLHRFVYVVLWLLVLHTGLQRISIWSVLIFGFAAVEIISSVYDYWMKQKSGALKAKNTG